MGFLWKTVIFFGCSAQFWSCEHGGSGDVSKFEQHLIFRLPYLYSMKSLENSEPTMLPVTPALRGGIWRCCRLQLLLHDVHYLEKVEQESTSKGFGAGVVAKETELVVM